ncbi:hypothetical protein ACJX0J_038693, partial [Zea mays]
LLTSMRIAQHHAGIPHPFSKNPHRFAVDERINIAKLLIYAGLSYFSIFILCLLNYLQRTCLPFSWFDEWLLGIIYFKGLKIG